MSEAIMYRDKDDGAHRYETPDYYEWWYFDSHFDNGYTCAAGFHLPFAHHKPHFPALNISIYTPEKEDITIVKPVDPAVCSAAADSCDVVMGEYFARQEGDDTYHIFGRSKRGGVDLRFKRTLPGWKPLGRDLFYDNGTEKHGWVVPCPRATVEGTLYVGDRAITVKGTGYHDHNWGSVSLEDSFERWFWGRLHHEDYTVIYGYVYPARQEEPVMPMLYMARGDRPLLSTDRVSLTYANEVWDDHYLKSVPRDLAMTAGDSDVGITMNIHCPGIAVRAEIAHAAPWKQYYWRMVASYEAEIAYDGKTEKISGIPTSEYMLLR